MSNSVLILNPTVVNLVVISVTKSHSHNLDEFKFYSSKNMQNVTISFQLKVKCKPNLPQKYSRNCNHSHPMSQLTKHSLEHLYQAKGTTLFLSIFNVIHDKKFLVNNIEDVKIPLYRQDYEN